MIRTFTIARQPCPTIPGCWEVQCLEWDVCTMGYPEDVSGAQHTCVERMVEALQLQHRWSIEDGSPEPAPTPPDVWDEDWGRAERMTINVELEEIPQHEPLAG